MLPWLHDWLTGNMGTQGRFEYQTIHWVCLAVVAAVLTAVLLAARLLRKDEQKRRTLVLAIAWFHLGFEVLWRVIYLLVCGSTVAEMWPLYPCNLGGILLPVIAIFQHQTGKKMFYLFGFVGAVLTFAYPDGIFVRDVLSFPILKSILQHTGLLMLPLVELTYGTFRPTVKDMGWVTAGCAVHFVNCEVITRVLGFTGDYMFYRSGLPFVIPGVSQYVTLSVFALLVLTLLAYLADVQKNRKNRKTPVA